MERSFILGTWGCGGMRRVLLVEFYHDTWVMKMTLYGRLTMKMMTWTTP